MLKHRIANAFIFGKNIYDKFRRPKLDYKSMYEARLASIGGLERSRVRRAVDPEKERTMNTAHIMRTAVLESVDEANGVLKMKNVKRIETEKSIFEANNAALERERG